jgi:hypothetical protein
LGTAFRNSYRHTTTRNWIRRLDASQGQIDGEQTVFPDASLQWNFRPTTLARVITSVTAGAGYARTAADISLPSLFTDTPPEFRRTRLETFPIRGAVTWADAGGLTTTAGYTLMHRRDSLPGSVSRTRADELSADVRRSFRVPASWNQSIKNPVRVRLGTQQTHAQTFILDASGGVSSRLQDNGRQAVNLSADTDLSDTVIFTVQGSQILTFDNNLNRRFAQTVFSTVMQVRFFGGR